MPSWLRLILNTVGPFVVFGIAVFLIYKGIDTLNKYLFSQKMYMYITALRYIGTLQARNTLAEINLETQPKVLVQQEYKDALYMAQMVSADTKEEILKLLNNKETQLYAIDVLGDIATDDAVVHLDQLVENENELVARGSVGALAQIARKRDYLRDTITEKLIDVSSNKEKTFGVRYQAFRSLQKLRILNVTHPWPTLTDAWRLLLKASRPVALILLILLMLVIMDHAFWSGENYYSDNFDDSDSTVRWGEANSYAEGMTRYLDGTIELTSRPNITLNYWGQMDVSNSYGDVVINVEAFPVMGNGSYGLMLRSKSWDDCYAAVIGTDGSLYLYRGSNGVFNLKESTYSPAISTSGLNRMTLHLVDNQADIYINDAYAMTYSGIVHSSGTLGLIVFQEGEEDFTARFEKIETTEPVRGSLQAWYESREQTLAPILLLVLLGILISLIFT